MRCDYCVAAGLKCLIGMTETNARWNPITKHWEDPDDGSRTAAVRNRDMIDKMFRATPDNPYPLS